MDKQEHLTSFSKESIMSKEQMKFMTVNGDVTLTIGSKTYNPETSLPLVEVTKRSFRDYREEYLASFRMDVLWDRLADYLSEQCMHDDPGIQRRAEEAKAVLELRTQEWNELCKKT